MPTQTPEARRSRRARWRALTATIASITIAGTAVAFDPDETRLIVQLALTMIGVVAMASAAGALRRAAPTAPRSPLDRLPARPKPEPVPLPLGLVRTTRRIAAAEASAADARRHLGAVVATVAADRLRSGAHHAIDSESVFAELPRPVPASLALVLDPALADLDTRALPGLDADAVDALVRVLEEL
jgi:hypothetical protein